MVQWLRLHASNARGVGSIPGWGIKIPHAAQRGQKAKTKNHAKCVRPVNHGDEGNGDGEQG